MKKIGPAEFEELKEKFRTIIGGIHAIREDVIELQRKYLVESPGLINDLGKALNKSEQAYQEFIDKHKPA